MALGSGWPGGGGVPGRGASTGGAGRLPRGMRLSEMLRLTDQTDESGRLLLEDSAPKQARKKAARMGVAMRTEPCPFKDTPSRLGGSMNVSAYEALRRDTVEILGGFAWLHRQHAERHPARRGTTRALVDMSKLGITLPLVLFHRGADPVPSHGRLPPYIASIFKASRGLVTTAVELMNRLGPSARPSAEEAVTFADQEGHLIRPQTGRACAAPTKLIERTIHVLLTGEGGDAANSSLGRMLDFDMLWRFHLAEESFSDACNRYGFVLGRLSESAAGVDPRRLFDAVVEIGGDRWSFGEFTQAFLERANAVQGDLNRLLGRSDTARPISYDDIPSLL